MRIKQIILMLIVFIIIAIIGFISGGICSIMVSMIGATCDEITHCGREEPWESWAITALFTIAYCIIGYLAKSWRNWRRFIATFLLLSLMTLLTGYLAYIYQATHRGEVKSIHGIIVNEDFVDVLRAKKPIPSLNIKKGDWCSLGYVNCDAVPKYIESYCNDEIINITEPYWEAFESVPEEIFISTFPSIYYRNLPKNYPKNACQHWEDEKQPP